MDRELIIRLAREAGFADGVVEIVGLEGFSRFADLVAAHEREACAKACDEVDRRWINQADKCAAVIRSRA